MDVTPQLIEQIDFSEKFRGYDPDQVDDFLERVGATIAELNNAVRDANERADRAEAAAREALAAAAAAPPPVAAAPAGPTDEEAANAAARTLMLAQRTADQLIAESRAEADQMVGEARARLESATRDAQAEADRLMAEARTQADGIVRSATEEAERELAGRRAEVAQQVADLDARKQTLGTDIAALESRLGEYRDSLDRVQASIRTILDDPDALHARPALEVDMAPVAPAAPFLDATASEPVAPVAEASVADSAPSFAPEAPAPAPAWAEDPAGDAGFTFPATAPTPVAAVTEPAVDAAPDPEVAYQPFDAGADGVADTADAPADPWGPGSWSEVIGEPVPEPAPAVAWDSVAFTPAPGDAAPAVTFDSFDAFTATGSSPAVGQDRYLRDLDEAVNQADEPADDAMTAFFEGDDVEEPKPEGRRFRRR